MLHVVIADRASDTYLGEAMVAPGEHRVGEVGCCVVPAARGRGIATEALRLLTNWAFDVLELGRVQVFVAPENVAALRLAESAGFRREGVLRSYWEHDETRLDAVVLARLPDDDGRSPSARSGRSALWQPSTSTSRSPRTLRAPRAATPPPRHRAAVPART